MTPELVITLADRALQITLLLMLLLLLPALAVGLVISMFQAATQINEMTLSFIPKLLITVGVLIFAGPYIIRLLTDYTTRLYESIPGYIG
jgi:flagellar biosynthetic protein FliQ|tara:strand:+ start:1066 stop:1335 length:270 start_codon:yes stop_codon:yes gene_type:complete